MYLRQAPASRGLDVAATLRVANNALARVILPQARAGCARALPSVNEGPRASATFHQLKAARQRYLPSTKGHAPALPPVNERPRASTTSRQRKAARQRYVSSANFDRSTVLWTLPRPSASAQCAAALYSNIAKVP
ncbi:unnamed protein product [Bursaphelenchus xylophilus]|uniref:(pine wood nematode) hypothetical protein n=1 Tax=Bursaphelenchus xylophilus TaxID=6326 RepID=A0A1I7SNW8_BURXY|nr:unnamed protein product [Bursaphelenchus xylophilus]CAG9080991.1 unnamed protein product [Bursaphelenchus xylophilus]